MIGNTKESALQVFLLRSMYANESQEKENETSEEINDENPNASSEDIITKRNMTREWIKGQQVDLKRQHNGFDETGNYSVDTDSFLYLLSNIIYENGMICI